MGKFKNWFFKGRIEKIEAKENKMDSLTKEYNEGYILRPGELIKKRIENKNG